MSRDPAAYSCSPKPWRFLVRNEADHRVILLSGRVRRSKHQQGHGQPQGKQSGHGVRGFGQGHARNLPIPPRVVNQSAGRGATQPVRTIIQTVLDP